MKPADLLQGLPGEALLRQGMADFHARRPTPAACLVEIALPRLRRARLVQATLPAPGAESELRLYRLLKAQGGDAYSRYNALLRELVSFEQALDHRTTARKHKTANRRPRSP
jgi:hypothetical protein